MPVLLMLLLISFSSKGQEEVLWQGKVINGDTGESVPNAVVAVYSKTSLYSTDFDGIIRIRLNKNDSVRVVVLGYSAETFRINALKPDLAGFAVMKIYPVSYFLQEVVVKGYKGILDPNIFPKFEDDGPKINMNLPKNIGSRMSEEPPSERLLSDRVAISYEEELKEALMTISSPVFYVYSKFCNEQKSIKQLKKVKYQQYIEDRLKNFITPEAIANITGYEGAKLQKFIIHCNANLTFHHNDTGVSITAKIEEIFEKYKETK